MLVEYLAEVDMMSLTKGQMAEMGLFLTKVTLSLTKGQTAPSLALVAILVAQLTKGGVRPASSRRHRAMASSLTNFQLK